MHSITRFRLSRVIAPNELFDRSIGLLPVARATALPLRTEQASSTTDARRRAHRPLSDGRAGQQCYGDCAPLSRGAAARLVVGFRRLGCKVEAEPKGAFLALFRQELQLPFQRPRDLVLRFLGVAAGAALRFGRLGSHGRIPVIAVS